MLARWSPNITSSRELFATLPVWIQIWGLPLEYFRSFVAIRLGRIVERVVQVDSHDETP
ncbi:hypothetical protein V6Z12_D05G430000 [Gossypium hirsutum]